MRLGPSCGSPAVVGKGSRMRALTLLFLAYESLLTSCQPATISEQGAILISFEGQSIGPVTSRDRCFDFDTVLIVKDQWCMVMCFPASSAYHTVRHLLTYVAFVCPVHRVYTQTQYCSKGCCDEDQVVQLSHDNRRDFLEQAIVASTYTTFCWYRAHNCHPQKEAYA